MLKIEINKMKVCVLSEVLGEKSAACYLALVLLLHEILVCFK